MTILTFPTIRRPSGASYRLRGNTQSHRSPLDGTEQTLEMPGAVWELTASWESLGTDDQRVLAAFLADLRGGAGRFTYSPAVWTPRRATGGGTPLVNGGGQTGKQIITDGWTGEAMANLVRFSADFDAIYWTKNNSTISPNAIAAPDGTLTADKLIENTATGSHDVRRIVAVAATDSLYTLSAYVRPAERTLIELRFYGPDALGVSAFFNLGTGTLTSVSGSYTEASGAIVAAGGGWFRASLTARTNSAATTLESVLRLNAAGPVSTYLGDGTSGVHIWGAQLELGAAATAYTPPYSVFAARAGDWLSFDDISGRRRLHMVTADAMANTSGQATLSITPPIRRSPLDNAALDFTTPSGVFRMPSDDAPEMSIRPPMLGALTLTMVEALV